MRVGVPVDLNDVAENVHAEKRFLKTRALTVRFQGPYTVPFIECRK